MTIEPYQAGLINKNIFTQKRKVMGEFVALTDITFESRGLKLIAPFSRVISTNEIHELMITDERDAGPDKVINRVSVMGFFEVKIGGVVVVGDVVIIKRTSIGEIAGFDMTHAPNHLGIVVKTNTLNLFTPRLGEKIIIIPKSLA